jgi:1,4-dihydroxy-2-naphthoate octaprenyltransferase
MTQDISTLTLAFIVYLIGAAFTYWGTRQNRAPRWAAFLIAGLYPVLLPIVIFYQGYDDYRNRY